MEAAADLSRKQMTVRVAYDEVARVERRRQFQWRRYEFNDAFAFEMLKQRAGIQATHIPYKGSGPATIALMSGEVDFSFAGALTSLPHVRSGRIKALAVTTPKPSALLPDVPPLATLYPGFEASNWYGFFAPAGTPAPIVNKVSAEIAAAIRQPDVREFMTREGAEPVGSSPPQFAAFFKSEVDRYAQVIRTANIRLE